MDRKFVSSVLPHILFCAAAGLTLTLPALLAAALLISAGRIPETRFHAAAAVCAGLGALTAGFLAGRRAGARVLIAGLAAGCVLLALLFLLGAVFFPGLGLSAGFLPIGGAVLACSAAGAVLTALRRR